MGKVLGGRLTVVRLWFPAGTSLDKAGSSSVDHSDPLEIRLHFAHGAKLRCHVRLAEHEQQSTGLLHLIFRISILFRNNKSVIPKRNNAFIGDPLEIRTPDPLLKRQLLCQLS